MYFDYSAGPENHRLYFAGKYLAKILSAIVYKSVKVKGRENIPDKGGFILVSNHIAFSDPAIIAANCNVPVHFMAKSELFQNRYKAAFMRHMNAFPVKRNHFDRAALKYAVRVIDGGLVLGVFPEGRRVRNSPPTESKNGVAYLARLTEADVLPVCIYRHPDDTSLWHRLTLSFGKIIRNDELKSEGSRTETLDYASEIIMKKIKELWENEHEGNSC
ncbi:MAG: 1-acyl-sn-glycerol-3-phosphate acyltransferase [Clostridia bacterium]|nr:1-acyl-sn-glycerol-3-phosphate acyltransferase [Clostridia bacterium]